MRLASAMRARPFFACSRRMAGLALCFITLLGLASCNRVRDGKHATVRFSKDGRHTSSFQVEVVATPEERARGLMFRKSLEKNEGMLFLFPREQQLAFWMKNTFLSLDMVFVSGDWKVVGVLRDVPPLNEERRMVDGNSQYVLEFGAGTAAREGIEQGMAVDVQGVLPPAS